MDLRNDGKTLKLYTKQKKPEKALTPAVNECIPSMTKKFIIMKN